MRKNYEQFLQIKVFITQIKLNICNKKSNIISNNFIFKLCYSISSAILT